MNLNIDQQTELRTLDAELQDWLKLQKGTDLDKATEEEYKQISTRIQEALMSTPIMDNNDVIMLLVTNSAIQTNAIKTKLLEVTTYLTEEDKEAVEQSIADIIAFESRTDLLGKGEDRAIKPEDHTRLILKILDDKKGLVYATDLNEGYEDYRGGTLSLGPEKFSGLGSAIKTPPFEFLSTHLQEALGKASDVFTPQGKTYLVKPKLPVNIKGNVQLFSIKLALTQSELAGEFGKLLRNTISFKEKDLKASITGASGVLCFDFSILKFSLKLDLFKLEDGFKEKNPKFDVFNVVAQVDITSAFFDALTSSHGHEGEIKMLTTSITPVSIKFDITLDAVAYAKIKLKDEALKKALAEKEALIKEAGKEAVEELDKMDNAAKKLVKSTGKIAVEGIELQKLQKDRANNSKEILSKESTVKKYLNEAKDNADKLKNASSKLEGLIKGKKAPLIRAAKSKLLGATSKIVRSNTIKAVGRVAAKFVPILNLISLAHDIYSIISWLFPYMDNEFKNARIARKMQDEIKAAREAEAFRKAAEQGSTIKRYVILKMYTALPRYDDRFNMLNHNSEPDRFPVYLKFYEDSSIGRAYFRSGKYKDRLKEEGVEESVGLGVEIDFYFLELGTFYEKVPTPNTKGDTNFGKLELDVFDKEHFESHKHYPYLKKREQLREISTAKDYVKPPK